MTAALYFVTHPEVRIDPEIAVPDWGLSEKGTARMRAFAAGPIAAGVRHVWSSAERKAIEGAAILADRLDLLPRIEEDLHENDRSATGFLPPDEFWPVVEQFFANPDESIRGWERSADAQARIVRAVDRVRRDSTGEGDIAIVAHGGVGALLLAHLRGEKISREFEQPHGGGGCFLTLSRESGVLADGWRNIDEAA